MKSHNISRLVRRIRARSRLSSPYLLIFSLIGFIVFVLLLSRHDFKSISNKHDHHRREQQKELSSNHQPLISSEDKYDDRHIQKERVGLNHDAVVVAGGGISVSSDEGEKVLTLVVGRRRKEEEETGEYCDVFSGKWVRDDLNRPLYEESECPYIQPQLTCKEHGRVDREYQLWKWKPHSCSLPSFNATRMLEALRGKRMMFVGDSLNRGQYVSMVCLLHRLIPEHAKSMETFDSLTVFTAKEYNATIEFYWAPFLLESNSDNAVIHRVNERIVRKGSINKHGKFWKGADILVFNTYLWWMTGSKFKILQNGSFEDGKDIKLMETEDAYRMAMKSMVRWLEKNADPKKSKVFFTSMSPSHGRSVDWGGDKDGNCYNQTSPIEDPSYWGSGSRKSIMSVIGEVFSKSKVPITFLNITQLSEYRKDAHTSIYKKQWSPLTAAQLANPVSYADCTHWCLPGLQDTWNELLYAKFFGT